MTNDLVLPLALAEPRFLNVLLPSFLLHRDGQGARLEVRFDDRSDCIWSTVAKDRVRAKIPRFSTLARLYQSKLDGFLLEGRDPVFEHTDAAFPFRYGSGGTLPIIRMGRREYYCLFFREIWPIGWNIANGGCESRAELLRPTATIERELREELVIIDPEQERWFLFVEESGRPLNHPSFAAIRDYWRRAAPDRDFTKFEETEIPIKWYRGPDNISIKCGDAPPVEDEGYFLNINAHDYGIEVDRIAKIHIPETAIICDGEVLAGHLVNAPVGLFEVRRFEGDLARGAKEFRPDFLFHNAHRYDGSALDFVVDERFLPDIRDLLSDQDIAAFEECSNRYDLCPVTRSIARRAAALPRNEAELPSTTFDIFVSHAYEDRILAKRIYEWLQTSTGRSVFLSEEEMYDADFSSAIDDVLDSARALVAVATHPQYLRKNWVDYEWRSFHVDLLSGGKPNGQALVSLISGFEPGALPRPLRFRHSVEYDASCEDTALAELARYVA